MKKLPENPFKETDKLTEKLTLDIADKTDKVLIESLNDLIKAGILEVRVLQPHTEFHENCLTVKSGVQVVPKFDEYTKKLEEDLNKSIQENKDLTKSFLKLDDYSEELEDIVIKLRSENSELKKQLIHLSEQQTERIQRTVTDKQYIMKLEAEVESLKERIESGTRLLLKVQQDRKEFFEDLKNAERALDESRRDCEFLLNDKAGILHDKVRAEEEYEKLKSKYDSLTENLTAAMEAADFLNKFLKLEK